MNNSEVLCYPSWVYNSSFSRGLHCSKLMNHHQVSSCLPSTGSVATLTLLLHWFQQSKTKIISQISLYPSNIPTVKKSSYNLLAISVYFTAHLRISLICFHHLLYSFKTSFIIVNSQLYQEQAKIKNLFLGKSLCFHILALCHNISKDGL